MREALCQPLSVGRIARHCGVPPRTLNEHFRAFVGTSPSDYLRRLRLAAAREDLLTGRSGLLVTEVAKRYCFHHFGRFAEHYRKRFGETPSETLHRARSSALSDPVDSPREAPVRRSAHPAIPAARASRDKPSLAILLAQPPTNDPALRSLLTAVAEAIAASLSSVRSLKIIMPTSLRAALRDPQQWARELGARYFLTGTATRAHTRLRIIVRVAEAHTLHHVWGDSFEGHSDQPLELQDRIVAGVLRAIPPNIRGADIERALRTPIRNLDANGLSMRALPFLFASRPDATRRALELLHSAIEIDPDYGLAAALAAWGHSQLVAYNATPAPAEEKRHAGELTRRAAMLNEDDPLVLTARCAVHTMTREFETAESLARRALALDPACGWAWSRSGWLHSYRGQSDLAIEHFGRALSLGATTSRANDLIGIATAHFDAGRYEASVFWLQSALRQQPGAVWANRSLSVAYVRVGDRLQALRSLECLRRSFPDLTVREVVGAVPFRPQFLDRLGDGLSALGLPP